MTDQLLTAIFRAARYLDKRHGIKINLDALKRRDPREPGRKEKDKAETELAALFRRIFSRQKAQIEQRAATLKRLTDYDDLLFDDDFDATDEEIAALVRLLQKYTQGGIYLFRDAIGDVIDYTQVNTRAAEAARKLALALLSDIGKTTKDAIRQAVATFVETAEFTIGDLIALLPFDPERAERIAITEVTRAYALGQHEAGVELRNEFPDVEIVKMWFTNADDRVCPICEPLDGKTVRMDYGWGENGEEDEEGIMDPPAHVNCRCWIDYTTDITR